MLLLFGWARKLITQVKVQLLVLVSPSSTSLFVSFLEKQKLIASLEKKKELGENMKIKQSHKYKVFDN